jgi:hypothetical protein
MFVVHTLSMLMCACGVWQVGRLCGPAVHPPHFVLAEREATQGGRQGAHTRHIITTILLVISLILEYNDPTARSIQRFLVLTPSLRVVWYGVAWQGVGGGKGVKESMGSLQAVQSNKTFSYLRAYMREIAVSFIDSYVYIMCCSWDEEIGMSYDSRPRYGSRLRDHVHRNAI